MKMSQIIILILIIALSFFPGHVYSINLMEDYNYSSSRQFGWDSNHDTVTESYVNNNEVEVQNNIDIEKELSIGDKVAGQVDENNRNKVYAVQLSRGDHVDIILTDLGEGSRATRVRLLSPASTSIDYDDLYEVLAQERSFRTPAFTYYDAEITYTAATTGIYYIWVHCEEGTTPYELEIEWTGKQNFDYPSGDDIPGAKIDFDTDYRGVVDAITRPNNIYAIDLEKGDHIIISLSDRGINNETGERSSRLRILSPQSTSIKHDTEYEVLASDRSYRTPAFTYYDAELTYTAATTGTYYIWVKGTAWNTPYVLNVDKHPQAYDAPSGDDIPGLPLGFDTEYYGVVDASLSPHDLYSIELQAGVEVFISLTDKGSNSEIGNRESR